MTEAETDSGSLEALRKFRLIADVLPALIAYVDAAQRFQFNNATYEAWFGVPRETLNGMHISELLGDTYATVKPHIDAVLKGDAQSFDVHLKAATKSGNLQVNYVPDRNARGEVLGFFILSHDITERKDASERLRLSEARLKEAQRLSRLGSWERDIATSEVWWSDEIYRILGVNPQESRGTYATYLERVHPDDRQGVIKAAERAAQGSGIYDMEHRIVLPDGEVRIVHDRAKVVFDDAGCASRIIGTSHDITERKRAQDTISEILARHEALTSAAFDGFAIFEDGKYLEASDRLAQYLGYELKELTGQSVTQTVTPSSLPIIFQHSQAGEDSAYEIALRRKDGTTFPAEVRGTRVTYHGRNARIVAFRDISERVALQREITSTRERERREVGRDLHDGVGQTLTGISLGMKTLSQKLEREGSVHTHTVQDLTRMVQKTISESRRMARVLAPSLGVQGLHGALQSLAAEISEHSNVALHVDCPFEMVFGDDETVLNLYRLIQEGVNNAIRHGKAKHIEVLCRNERGMIHVEVLDDGAGIPLEKDRGRGIGLGSMRQRAQTIGGTLSVASRPEGGTRVLCSYPPPG